MKISKKYFDGLLDEAGAIMQAADEDYADGEDAVIGVAMLDEHREECQAEYCTDLSVHEFKDHDTTMYMWSYRNPRDAYQALSRVSESAKRYLK